MGLAENPSLPALLLCLYKNPETYIAEHASAELRRREEKKEEASSLPRWLKGAKENVLGLRSVVSISSNHKFHFYKF